MLRTVVAAAMLTMAAPAAADPIPNLSLDQLEHSVVQGDLGKIVALAAEQHGEIVYRRRFDGQPAETPIDIRSAGKSITALAVGAAIADGKLAGVEVHVWPYLGAPRGEPLASVTVADLLSMSSALDCNDWERASPGQEERMYRTRIWRQFALELPSRAERGFSYCTAGVFLLGQVVEQAVGEPFDTYVQRRLFDPLGITGVTWRRSSTGEVQSGGQLTISDGALLRLGRMVLDGGRWNGQQVLPDSWIRTMLTPRHQVGEAAHYGYLWWAMPLRSPRGLEGAWLMKGNGGNLVAILRDYDAVLVVQSRNYNKSDAERASFTALFAMIAALDPPR